MCEKNMIQSERLRKGKRSGYSHFLTKGVPNLVLNSALNSVQNSFQNSVSEYLGYPSFHFKFRRSETDTIEQFSEKVSFFSKSGIHLVLSVTTVKRA